MQDELKPQETLSETAEFILSFIQALLKTGYYTPGHPGAEKAKEGLYLSLMKTLAGRNEITFVSVQEKGLKDVMIDGLFDEPTKLSSLMFKGMAEMYIPKFLEYFERKHLTSFSMKSRITEHEFDNFINIMSESPLEEDTTGNLREKMTLDLIKNSIVSVSTVFNVELVGKERKLPWMVELALTRLKNDLSKIPLYKNVSEEKLSAIKAMVFDDIIRPIKMPLMIKEILVNLDLILFDTMGMTKEELEEEVMSYFNIDVLMRAAPELLTEYVKIKDAYEQIQGEEELLNHMENVREIAGKVALKLATYEKTEDSLLMEFVRHGLIGIDELPDEKKNKARRAGAVDNFLLNPEEYFKAIEKALDDELEQRCGMFADLLPELLLRSYLDEAGEIVRVITGAGFDFHKMDKEFFNEFTAAVSGQVQDSSKEDQLKLMEILKTMGECSIPVFVDLLADNSRIIRKIACDILTDYRAKAIPHLVIALDKRKHWHYTRNILMVLADIGEGGAEMGDIFRKYIAHEEQRVREEVIKGLTNVIGADSEAHLLDYMKDPSPSVRRKALWGLRTIKSTKPEVFSYLCGVLDGKIQEDEPIIEQALLILTSMGPRIDNVDNIENATIKILKNRGLMGKFTGKLVLSDKLEVKACEALGVIGAEKSIAVLKKLEKDESQELRDAAMEAIKKINSRTDSTD